MSSDEATAAAQDEIPFEVTDTINPDEVGDLTHVKRDDTMPAANDVRFQIAKASIDVRLDATKDGGDGSTWLVKALRIQAKVAEPGVLVKERNEESGEIEELHKYAGKVLFCDLNLVLNLPALEAKHTRSVASGAKENKPFNKKWWEDSRVDFKEFALATGLAAMQENTNGQLAWTMLMPINDELMKTLSFGDVYFIANVSRRENKAMDRFENRLTRFRPDAAPAG